MSHGCCTVDKANWAAPASRLRWSHTEITEINESLVYILSRQACHSIGRFSQSSADTTMALRLVSCPDAVFFPRMAATGGRNHTGDGARGHCTPGQKLFAYGRDLRLPRGYLL
jgi:hypothetical protein